MTSLKFSNVHSSMFVSFKYLDANIKLFKFFIFQYSIILRHQAIYYMVSLSPHTSIKIACACQTAMDDLHKTQHDLRKMQFDPTIPKCTS